MKTITLNHVNFEIKEKQTCGFCGEVQKACVVGLVPIQFAKPARMTTKLMYLREGMFDVKRLFRIVDDPHEWEVPRLETAGFSTICVDCLRQMKIQAIEIEAPAPTCNDRCCHSPIEKPLGGGVVGEQKQNTQKPQ